MGRRHIHGGILDPPEPLAHGGRYRTVQANCYLVAKEDVGDQEGQEVDCGKELVIASDPGVELGPLVMDQAVRPESESPEAHGPLSM